MRISLVSTIASTIVTVTAAYAVPPVVQIHPIVLEGNVVTGVGNISSGFGASETHSVNNSGEWLVRTDTDNPDSSIDGVILRGTGFTPGALFLQQGQALASPSGATISSFDSSNINNAGNTSFNHFLGNTGSSNNDSGVYFNNDLLIQESNIATAAGFGPNTPYIGFFETKINNNNLVAVMASIDDPNVTSTVDRAIVTVNPFSFAQTRIIGEGDALVPGRFVTDFQTGPHDMALNDSGHIMFVADIDGATTDDTITARYNGSGFDILMREGEPSAVGGRNWGTSAPVSIDMNNSGAWAAIADLDGSTSDDTIIVRNGTDVIAREGMSLASIGGVFTFTSFSTSGAINIDDNGNVVWWGDWNDPDTTKDTGIFWNDTLIVQEGVTLVDGLRLTAISGVESNISMSDNGQWIIFEGTLENGLDGAFMIEVPEPATAALALFGLAIVCRRRRNR